MSAGIGVIGMASPMLQEIFAGKLIGLPDVGFNQLDATQKAFVGIPLAWGVWKTLESAVKIL